MTSRLLISFATFPEWTLWAAGGVVLVILVVVITRALTKRKIISKIDFMSDAIVSGESAFRYSETARSNRSLNRSLNRLRSIFEAERAAEKEKESYFALMLDHVQSGVVVLEGEKVTYCNSIARGLLGMSNISSLRQIEKVSAPLAEAFRSAGSSEVRSTVSSERGTATLSISACGASLNGREVKIVTFNDITREMEDNESESWTRLIRVLTHEIMNTVTPIASLSAELSENLAAHSEEELRSALGTIASSSEGLISFVQSYRSLTHIAAPVRRPFYFREVATDAINIAGINWPAVEVLYTELSEDVILYADEGQISQVVNNLVKNAVQAGATRVEITSQIDSRDRTVISVSNNGEAISPSVREQLFIPFYTTKGTSGTGVGLSLSRQMLRLNGGTIALTSSTAEKTVFTIIL